MRLLNSVCRVIASVYSGVPVHIEEVPNNFERNSFYVTLATGSSELKNINVYEDDPIFQIVYFAKRNEANQVVAEKLYEVKEELKRLFLLKRVVPVIPLAGVNEKPRYAKIENYSDDVRVLLNVFIMDTTVTTAPTALLNMNFIYDGKEAISMFFRNKFLFCQYSISSPIVLNSSQIVDDDFHLWQIPWQSGFRRCRTRSGLSALVI